MSGSVLTIGNDVASIAVDLRVYSKDSVLRTAHRFTDRCGVSIVQDSDQGWVVQLARRTSLDNLERMGHDFGNALLDETLRAQIRADTEPIRRLLIAQAFSEVNLLRPELDDANPAHDPLRIGEPDGR